MPQKKLIKFIDAWDNKLIYIDPMEVSSVKDNSGNSMNQAPGSMTILQMKGSGIQINITEHIAVVIAKLQGLDSTPAEVIFGKE